MNRKRLSVSFFIAAVIIGTAVYTRNSALFLLAGLVLVTGVLPKLKQKR